MKGQMFTMDMALSMLVFMGLAGLSMAMVNDAFDTTAFLGEEELMQEKLYRTSDILVRTGGFPEGWNSTNVSIPGIAGDSHVINTEKFHELRRMDYRGFKSMNRIPRYDFYMEILVDQNTTGIGGVCQGDTAVIIGEEADIVQDVDGGGYKWDLYWFGPDENPYSGYRRIFNGSSSDMFEQVISNRSEYNCILAYNPGLSSEEVSNSHLLEEFVETNTYVQVGEGEIFEMFGGEPSSFSGNGTVISDEVLSKNISVGDDVVFESSTLVFEDPQNSFVDDENGGCGVCRFSSNAYYFTGDNVSFPDGYDGIYDRFFFGAESVFGKSFESAESVVPNSRKVVINRTDRNERAVANMVLWK